MVQQIVVYLIVAAATAYATWRLFLRGWLKRRAAAKAAGCGPDCACGD